MLATIQEFVQHEVAQNGYFAIFVLALLGSACIPIPSEAVLVFGGALASSAFNHQALGADQNTSLAIGFVIVIAVVASLIGSWIGYGLGAFGGRPLIDRWGKYLLFKPHEVDRAHAWFERHGQAVVFFGRLIPLVRAFVSLPAGVARMNLGKFTLYTLLGIIPWTVGLAFLGYALGERWQTVETYALPISAAVAIAAAIAIVLWARKRIRERPVRGGT